MNFRVMIATIRDLGMFPCPRCLVPKDEIYKIGTDVDRCRREESQRTDSIERQDRIKQARKNLYENGYALSAECVDGMLKDGSLVPTKVGTLHLALIIVLTLLQNVFSQALFQFRFNFFRMLTVDLLHEFELGLWKDFLTHLVRILEFLGSDSGRIFNERCTHP